jgi:hypothetical protein
VEKARLLRRSLAFGLGPPVGGGFVGLVVGYLDDLVGGGVEGEVIVRLTIDNLPISRENCLALLTKFELCCYIHNFVI